MVVKRTKLNIRVTCCNECHTSHRSKLAARFHYAWLQIKKRAGLHHD